VRFMASIFVVWTVVPMAGGGALGAKLLSKD
jgi:hypothetical protein